MSREKISQPVAHFPSIVGSVLQTLRKKTGLDQTQFAAQIGMTQSAWSRIETGTTPMTVSQLAAVAAVFRHRPSDLMRYAENAAEQLQQRGVRVEPSPPAASDDFALVLGAAVIAAIVLATIGSK